MITCPKCGSKNWDALYRSPIDPAEDKFGCRDCGCKWRRYDARPVLGMITFEQQKTK